MSLLYLFHHHFQTQVIGLFYLKHRQKWVTKRIFTTKFLRGGESVGSSILVKSKSATDKILFSNSFHIGNEFLTIPSYLSGETLNEDDGSVKKLRVKSSVTDGRDTSITVKSSKILALRLSSFAGFVKDFDSGSQNSGNLSTKTLITEGKTFEKDISLGASEGSDVLARSVIFASFIYKPILTTFYLLGTEPIGYSGIFAIWNVKQ